MKLMIVEDIAKSIKIAIKNLQKKKVFLNFDVLEAKIELPEIKAHGDYSSNIAMLIAGKAKKSPLEIAETIVLSIKEQNLDIFDKIEVIKPGFINFFLSREYLQKKVKEILKQKEKFGQLKAKNSKKINLEFCSANPTGPLHLGHGRGAFWGDTLARVLDKAGHKVTREYFINDYGKQILILGESINAHYKKLLGEKVEIKEEFYKCGYVREVAEEVFKNDKDKYIKISEDERIKVFTEMGLRKALVEAKKLLEKIGIKYDIWFSERDLYKRGLVKKATDTLKKKGVTYTKDGALWFSSTKFKDDKDRVLIKANGNSTYFLSDIAYHLNKVSRKYDLLINGWGSDHWGYVPRLKAAAEVFGFNDKLKIIVSQFVRLIDGEKEVKMSKRAGTLVTLKELINSVGPDVARFFFLMKSINTHIDFDLSLAKQQSEKNPVFYIQYAHARICSILNNAKNKAKDENFGLLVHASEINLIKDLIRFPEIVSITAKDYQIQRLPKYAKELATSFHQFYKDCRVISDDKKLSQARLVLVLSTKIVLKNTLDLMGISAPEKM